MKSQYQSSPDTRATYLNFPDPQGMTMVLESGSGLKHFSAAAWVELQYILNTKRYFRFHVICRQEKVAFSILLRKQAC